ncbi:MAG: PorP/SprF family type IX secretion system membrane protein, partial [Chitinophagaceae bacterium]
MKKWSLILLVVCHNFLLAQDVHLSQFFETPLLRNPALAGIFTGDVRLQAVYRNQWQSIGYPYQTSVLSGEYKFPVGGGNDFMTVGANFFYDVAGITQLKTLQVMPVLNYHKSLNGNRSSFLSAGFMAGFVQRSFDGNNITFDNQYTNGRYNPFAGTGENFVGLQRSFFDAATGLSYTDEIGQNGTFYIGASLWHFTKPSANFLQTKIQLNPKWQFNAGYSTPVSDNLHLKVELNYLKEGSYTEFIAGAMFRY